MARRHAVVTLALLVALGGAGTARADWLVLRDGSRIETRGAWQTRGRLVVFLDRRGNLASLRGDLVDEAASQAATNAATAAATAPAAAPARRKAVLVVRDEDLPKAPPVAANAQNADAAEPPGAAKEPIAKQLTVTNWQRSKTLDGIEVVGTLRNSGPRLATGVRLRLQVFDEQMSLRATAIANLSAGEILPDESVEFSAVFAGLDDFRTLRFEPTVGEPAPSPDKPAQ